ncbi:MAG TPA: hypothetical protein VMZ92_05920 [Planctomycetota bacterium]|nr:hypothetical protein [Planctomycetota bacterium]
MRVLVLSLAMSLLLPGTFAAGEEPYLSRTLDLDFRHPGSIRLVASNGAPPVQEVVEPNAHVLILPKRIKMTLSIANANEDRHHYHICVTVLDEFRPVDKAETVIRPDKGVEMVWLGGYRYQFMVTRKHAVGGNRFVTAQVKLDVYTVGAR